MNFNKTLTLREECPYSELFWSAFSRIWTEYGEILRISPYSVRMREMRARITPNTDTIYTVSQHPDHQGFQMPSLF